MMLIDEITLLPGLYRLPDDPVGPTILIPGFQSATSVRGAFGWFSAEWIARLAPGLAEYLNRQGTLPLDFIVSPVFFPSERAAVEKAFCLSTEEATKRIRDVFIDGKVHATALGKHALDCLSWMVATDFLRLRIAVPNSDSNYHPKMWLFDDGDHQVLARGSGNATGHGLSTGVEHLDVDVTWSEDSRKRVKDGITILEDWANGRSKGIDRVVALPDALKEDIIKIAPVVTPTRSDYINAAKEDNNPSWAVDLSQKLRDRFISKGSAPPPHLAIPRDIEWQSGTYAYQNEAVKAWENSSNPERGIISMATGAGKTITALICATRLQNRLSDSPLLVVISAPSIPIIAQWVNEVKKFGIRAIAPSLESDIASSLTGVFMALGVGGTHVLVVSNKTLCSPNFQSTLTQKLNSKIRTMFIADEAHTLGAKGFIANKPLFFERRLALSATPERQYDPDGTQEIFSFFGDPVYNFGLDRAIGFCLSPYKYYVHVTPLGGDELYEYLEITRRIGAHIAKTKANITDDTDDETLTGLLIRRRSIIETAVAKISLLQNLLEHRGLRSLTHTLIYVSAKNPNQFEDVGIVLKELDIRWAPVTQDTTAKSRLLEETLRTFEKGGYQVLLAKKVLDEGVNIPNIREAFIIASSTVEREWIQRRGRVLRLHPDKDFAMVHDFLALPPAEMMDQDARKIVLTELNRALAFAKHASNASGPEGVFERLKKIRDHYWDEEFSSPLTEHQIDPATPVGRQW